ncbi:hypothetical protein ACGVWS_05640 [Enterobacteriaceae bacterium LUAb1]
MILVLTTLMLSGCAYIRQAHESESVTAPDASASQNQPSQPENSLTNAHPHDAVEKANLVRVQQCRKELEAMRLYSQETYNEYLDAFQQVGATTNRYFQVKDALDNELIDLLTPRYQFQIRELCYRIKNRLSQLIIQAATS